MLSWQRCAPSPLAAAPARSRVLFPEGALRRSGRTRLQGWGLRVLLVGADGGAGAWRGVCAHVQAAGFAVEVVPDALLAEEYQGGAYAVLRLARRDGGGGTVAPGGAVEGAVANTVVEVGGAGGAPAGEAAEEDEPGENLEHKPCRQQ